MEIIGQTLNISKNKKIGLLLSGGFDSALLLHLICLHNDDSEIILFTLDKRDGSTTHINKIIENNDFRSNNYTKVTIPYDPEIDETKYTLGLSGRKAYNWVFANHSDDFEVLYSGNTTNPPEGVITFRLPTIFYAAPDRTRAETVEKTNSKFVTPFSKLTKKDTVRMVHELNLDYIVEHSHTCTTTDGGRCTDCWQCKEREWGFQQNNLVDFGTN